MLKQRIEQDLKKALLAGDKLRVSTLRGVKSVIIYAEVEKNVRDVGLNDAAILVLLSKEAKKRQESIDIYTQAGDKERAATELQEKAIIEEYLPQQMSDDELVAMVNVVIKDMAVSSLQAMGTVVGVVKQKVEGKADGARIAKAVKQALTL
jgi:hypothetical protein